MEGFMSKINYKNSDLIIANFGQVLDKKPCDIYTICVYNQNTLDYKGKFVARLFKGERATKVITLADTLEDIRKTIPVGFVRFGRSKYDDPVIHETWL